MIRRPPTSTRTDNSFPTRRSSDLQLSDPDYKDRPTFRESDLRRHLINELKVEDEVIQEDGKPDPRFTATAEELEKKGIEDYQLHYAVQAVARLANTQMAAAPKKTGTR